jgi:hypothetical protein
MKRILLLAILLISTLTTWAQRGSSTLRVRLSTNQKLSLAIDDRYYEKRGTSLTIADLPAGRHYLRIYNLRVGRTGRGRANLVYSGYINIRPNAFHSAVVDPYQRKMTMRTTQTFERPGREDVYENWNDRNYNNDPYRDDYNDNVMRNQDITDLGARVQDRMSDNDKLQLIKSALENRSYYTDQLRTALGWLSFESSKLDLAKWAYDNAADKENYWKLEDVFSFSSSKNELTEYIQGRGVINNSDNRYRDGYEYNNVNARAISDQDIADLGIRVKDRIGDSDKLTLVQSVLNGKEYYTDQLRTILGWFSFESTKLDFAKWAYANTIDQENYWKLEDVFSFSSTKTELTDYIQGRGRN